MTEVFLDVSYAIALSAPRDQHHLRAMQLAEKLAADAHFEQAGFRALLRES